MAQANVGSRRACEDLIRQGRVRVNGKVIHLGDQADPMSDMIEVDGVKLAFPDQHIYIAFNKPKNVVSSAVGYKNDDRRTIREMIPVEGHLFTIGRLDADSEGLIILTNDGDMANRLSHPRYRHTKTYKVVVVGLPSQDTLSKWENGIHIEDEETGKMFKTAPCSVKIVEGSTRESTLRIVMTEGKKRQIRRVAAILGHPVRSLTRTHIGKLALGALRPGEWRELDAQEIQALKTPADELRDMRSSRRGPVKLDQPAPRQRRPETERGQTTGKRGVGGRFRRDQSDEEDETRRPRGKVRGVRSSDTVEPRDDRPRRPRSTDSSERDERPNRKPRYEDREEAERPPRRRSKPDTSRSESDERKPRRRPTSTSRPGRDNEDKPRRRPGTTRTKRNQSNNQKTRRQGGNKPERRRSE
jgi:pseudouridine synthase